MISSGIMLIRVSRMRWLSRFLKHLVLQLENAIDQILCRDSIIAAISNHTTVIDFLQSA
ncbi:hypothetical protein Scep_025883 [Stephania cephalantha]|uniref:Uncharacterized protein n=1 Tax=Stephania cephalantha TaxID=152367 RepID=A0AAP0EJI5_9MAGN